MRNPLVSVLVCTYRSDRFLRLALEDAVSQTYRSIEVIVCDDANSPGTQAVVEQVGDPRIRYFGNGQRLGVAANHWAAMRRAQGELISILNHDDRWEPDFLERLSSPLIADETLVLSFCDHRVIDDEGRDLPALANELSARYGREGLSPGVHKTLGRLLVQQTIPMSVGAVFRHSSIDRAELSEAAGPAYDLWLTYLLAHTGRPGFYVADRLTAWREHSASQTATASREWLSGTVYCWNRVYRDPDLRYTRAKARRHLAHASLSLAVVDLRRDELASARQNSIRSLYLSRGGIKAAAILGLTWLPHPARKRLISCPNSS